MADKELAEIEIDENNSPVIEGTDKAVISDATAKEVSAENDEENEVIISIGEVSPASEENEAEAPVWVKDLRKSHKEQAKRIRELEGKLQQTSPQDKPTELGAKPTLEACDYDAEKFEAELTAYHERKRQVDTETAKRQQKAEDDAKAWRDTQAGYEVKKTALKVKDFGDAEDTVKETLSVTQQGIILQGSNDAALVVYALGKNKAEASRLAKITDPIKFAFEVARLEGKLKVSPRKPPPPEKTVKSGGSSFAAATDQTLERLRAEAEKTGNYTKVVAYKKQLREKGA